MEVAAGDAWVVSDSPRHLSSADLPKSRTNSLGKGKNQVEIRGWKVGNVEKAGKGQITSVKERPIFNFVFI